MNRKFNKILFAFCLSCLLLSCGAEKRDLELNDISFSMSLNDCEIEGDSCTYILIDYVLLKDEEQYRNVNDSITKLIIGSSTSAEEACKTFIDDYVEFQKEDSLTVHAWFDNRRGSIFSSHEEFISLVVDLNSYYGGAHPNHYRYYLNFDWEGNSKRLEAMVSPGNREKVYKIFEASFREEMNIALDVDWEESAFWFEDGVFQISENYLFMEEGILMYYNTYEIAPYSEGEFEIMVSKEKIKGLVDGY